ncbi:YihY/virulence factor BrkB family protein [Defluviimonas sp. WL0050]|uniref:YihY/virulence factor BrkB family protein n=1 Tax=Albidovulum litorale TaxID=2984134 RepID=A0ABT2ZN58_9RHOB|nr:YihY/virulence factor BrkB family protein [Defluviimonas sp. WL0050]MCV2872569.1 YihY/virulence factor BrkB family protein [Defluviimonas sp. WL0050]
MRRMFDPKFLVSLARSVWHATDDRHLSLISAGVAFYAMLAIFPAMAATIAIWGLFSDPTVMREYLFSIHEVIPDAAYEIIETQLNALLDANTGTLGWASAVSLMIALYSVHSGVTAMIMGLNAIHASRRRVGLARHLGSIALTLVLIALFLFALVVVVIVPIALNFVPFDFFTHSALRIMPWAVMFLVVMVVLGLFYRWGPNMPARHQWITPGAVLAALLWAAASMAFSAYLENFGTYNRLYGSIGAVVALMMWLYLSAYIVLLGAAVNAERARLLRDQ